MYKLQSLKYTAHDMRIALIKLPKLLMTAVIIIALLLVVQVSFAQSEFNSEAWDESESNYSLWRSHNISGYDIVSETFCRCRPESVLPGRIQVRANTVTKTYVYSGLTIDSYYATSSQSYLTIEEAFLLIQSTLLNNIDRVDVTYNATYGYPTSIYLDYSEDVADDEYSIELTEFSIRSFSIPGIPLPTPLPVPVPPIILPPFVTPLPVPLPPIILTPVVISPVASCQVYPQGFKKGSSIAIVKDNINVWACIRGLKSNPCDTLDIIAKHSASEFRIISNAVDSGTVCSQVITPFAELVQLDIDGLDEGVYTVEYHPLHWQGNKVKATFSLP